MPQTPAAESAAEETKGIELESGATADGPSAVDMDAFENFKLTETRISSYKKGSVRSFYESQVDAHP